LSEGYSNYGEESRDQTEHHVGEKSNKPFNVAYSFFQVSRVADGLVASVWCFGPPAFFKTAMRRRILSGTMSAVSTCPGTGFLTEKTCSLYCIGRKKALTGCCDNCATLSTRKNLGYVEFYPAGQIA
jgi:hypothetical protein